MNPHPVPRPVGPDDADVREHVIDVSAALAGQRLAPRTLAAITAAVAAASTPIETTAGTQNP
ncbi:hypothetical protein [Nocardia niigatensis]